jgi:hypothetical protein
MSLLEHDEPVVFRILCTIVRGQLVDNESQLNQVHGATSCSQNFC